MNEREENIVRLMKSRIMK